MDGEEFLQELRGQGLTDDEIIGILKTELDRRERLAKQEAAAS